MKRLSIYTIISWLLAFACLLLGRTAFSFVQLILFLLLILLLLLNKKNPFWLSSIALALYLLLVVLQLETEQGTGWLLFGSAFALAGWDLRNFQAQCKGDSTLPGVAAWIREHEKNLLLVLLISLGTMGIARNLSWQLPFWLELCLASIGLLGILWFLNSLKNAKKGN